jgi:integral membrane protein (TIGR00529 family)
MGDILKVFLVFILILFLLKRKWDISYALLLATGFFFILYPLSIISILRVIKEATLNYDTLKLILILSLIRAFERVLREKEAIPLMMTFIRRKLRNRKVVTASMPLIIGLLPSIGGAYFSAPFVNEATQTTKLAAEEKGFINYWMRHPWEYVLPLYPGIILASSLSGIELYKLILANLVYALFMILTGFILGMKKIKGSIKKEEKVAKGDILSFLPIIGLLFLVIILRIELHYALILVLFILFIFYKYNFKIILSYLRYAFSLPLIILILAIMLFKSTIESSGAIENITEFLIKMKSPVLPFFFFLPFVVGLLTGLTIGFVGITFPLLLSIKEITVTAISFAFAAGYLGVLLSPVHACLLLTKEYFGANLLGIYKQLLLHASLLFCVIVLNYLLFASI